MNHKFSWEECVRQFECQCSRLQIWLRVGVRWTTNFEDVNVTNEQGHLNTKSTNTDYHSLTSRKGRILYLFHAHFLFTSNYDIMLTCESGTAIIKIWDVPEGLFTQKNPRTPRKKIRKIRKKSKRYKNFFEDLKSVQLIWECTTPRFQCLNPFLFIKSSYTQENPEKNPKKSKKIQKNPKNLKIRTTYLGVNNPSISVFKYFFYS